MAPPCATCPNAPKTPTEWFQSLGVATQPLLVLLVASSVFINMLQQIAPEMMSNVIVSSLVFLPRSLLDYSPVISIGFLFKMLLLAGLLDRVEKQVCGEYLPSIMAFPGRRLFTTFELANGAQAINREYLVRSLRLIWLYVLVGGCIVCVLVCTAISMSVWESIAGVLVVGSQQKEVPIYDQQLYGSGGMMTMTMMGWRSRLFYASEAIPLALMFLLGTMLPSERMALPSILSGMLSKVTSSNRQQQQQQQQQRGFATGQNMNTYDQYQASQEKRKGYKVFNVALVYMALDLLFFGSGWVSTLSALVVGGGIGTVLSKEYDRMISTGGGRITSLSEWRSITPPMVVNTAIDLTMTKLIGNIIFRGLAKLFKLAKMKCDGNNNVPVKLKNTILKLQVGLEKSETYYSTKWVFNPHEQLDVPQFIHQTIRQRNLKKFEKLKEAGARTPWAKQR